MTPRVLYLINTLAQGGAEQGVVELIRNGAFEGCELKTAVLAEGVGLQRQPLTALGAAPINLSGQVRLTPIAWLASARALNKLLQEWRPDALILSLPQANILGRLLAFCHPKLLVCSFEHNTKLAKRAYEWGYRLTSGRVDWLLADSAQTATVARRRLYWTSPKQTFVLPLVVFRSEPSLRRIWSQVADGPFEIVAAGRLTAFKSHALLIEAIAKLMKEIDLPLRLTIYGEGEERAALQQAVQNHGLEEQIRLAGFNPRWFEMPGDLFVLPSLHEGLSLATLEAMHAGIPVLATRVGGLFDYGDAAETMPVAGLNAERLSHAIKALIESQSRRAILQEKGMALTIQRYGPNAVQQTFSDFNVALHQATARRSPHLDQNAAGS